MIAQLATARLVAPIILCLSIASTAGADAREDAERIARQAASPAIIDAALNAQRPLIIGAIENELRGKGIRLPDPDRFYDLFFAEFKDIFYEELHAITAEQYLGAFTPRHLAEIAAFLESPAGTAWTEATPGLIQRGGAAGAIAGERAGQQFGARLGRRLEEEGLIVVDDPSTLRRLLDALR
ncbi:MAG: DUF2059 domain-containing protein [Shimia sp.]